MREMFAALDVLCPMHVMLDPDGCISHAGPTLRKLRPDRDFDGARVLDILHVTRPRPAGDMAALLSLAGRRLRLTLRGAPGTQLCGVLMPDGAGGALMNLAFGISIVDAVRDYTLTNEDFAPTDLAVEMLYLVEAKSSAMDMLREMSLRAEGARRRAEEQAVTDALTGLRNRRALDRVLDRMVADRQDFALMHLDLDRFKAINDTLGHAAGDHVLRRVARIMTEETRTEDTVARVGGDEFVLVFRGLTDRARIDEIARRLIERIEEPVPFEGQMCRISASAGTAISERIAQPEIAELMAAADAALYAVKRSGRGHHRFARAPSLSTANEPDKAGCAAAPTRHEA